MSDALHICRRGTWRYTEDVEVPVRIVAVSWNLLPTFDDEDEEPEPPPEGLAYCIQIGYLPQYGHEVEFPDAVDEAVQGAFARTARLLEYDRFTMRGAHPTEEDAIADAEALLGDSLRWATTRAPAP